MTPVSYTHLLSDVEQVAQRSAMRYDRGGDAMYDLASALMKSLRGSDPDAALHYLARFLEAGDLVTPCRRLLCSASEDVGMAYPQAISIVKACVDTAMQLGLPEAQLPLAQAAILLATAPKSNSVVEGIGRAWSDAVSYTHLSTRRTMSSCSPCGSRPSVPMPG